MALFSPHNTTTMADNRANETCKSQPKRPSPIMRISPVHLFVYVNIVTSIMRMICVGSLHSKKLLLTCTCIYLLAATGGTAGEGATTDASGEGGGWKNRYLRSATMVVAATFDDGPGATVTVSSTSVEKEEEEEEFDYESYHTKHHIPVPALGATMMGFMNPVKSASTASTSSSGIVVGTVNADDNAPQLQQQQQQQTLEDEDTFLPRGIIAFAGTSDAMKNFASGVYSGDVTDNNDDDSLTIDSVEKASPSAGGSIDGNSNAMTYDATLAQISKSRSSLLYGSNPSTNSIETDSVKHASRRKNEQPTSPLKNQRPRLPKTDSDLDRGRHLVGLEVREVQPHQRIIVDYQDSRSISNMNDFEEQQLMRPIRVLYLLSDDANVALNADGTNYESSYGNLPMLSTLLDTSFNRTAALWSRALSLAPVVGNILPTVKTCGSARIPEKHRETGVKDADIVIYVTGDNKYCGGAIMHSAICDFDQKMRPLVANINICTKNVPTTIAPDYGVQVLNFDDYEGYISTETARVLGASTSLLRHFNNPDTGIPYGSVEKNSNCVDGTQETISLPNIISEDVDSSTGQVYYEIRTPSVIEVVRNHFGCMTMTGARLGAKKGTTGCFGGFLDERLFFGEQLSGFQIAVEGQVTSISPLTLALLEDSSWYLANFTVSSEMSFGRGAGCQFAHGSCDVDDDGAIQVNAHGKGFHCAEIGKMGCDITHSFKARCDALVGGGSSPHGDICPMYVRGAIDCAHGTPDSPLTLPGEVYGESSKCFLTDEGQPICLRGTCNEEKQGVDIRYEDEVFTCTRNGQIIDTQNGLRIECPRIAAVCPDLVCPSNCSARGVCDEDRDGKYTCICDDPFDDSPGCWGQR